MSITLFGISTALGFLVSGYYLWLRAKGENLPEDEIFDIYIVSAIWALAVSRGVEIAVRFNEFGWNIIRWFSVFSLPGLNGLAALLTFICLVYLAGVKRHKPSPPIFIDWLTGFVIPTVTSTDFPGTPVP